MHALHMKQIPDITPHQYVELVTSLFLHKADPLYAEKQMAYMRHQFEYCGLNAKIWYPMAKAIFKEHGMFQGKELKLFVELCFDQSYREVLYVGIEMLQRRLPEVSASWIQVLDKCMVTHSWWDTVDWLAKLAGIHFKNYPHLQHDYCYKWIEGSNMWLQRAAIIHQLFYKEDTNEKLLFDLIRQKSADNEFFIRKACGWALRQYSKTRPKAVTRFVDQHDLSPLTRKEALRLIV